MSQTAVEARATKRSTIAVQLQATSSSRKDAKSIDAASSPKRKQIWWSNAIFFVAFHLIGLLGFYYKPSSWRTWLLLFLNWQIGTLGITIGNLISLLPTLSYRRISSSLESS